MLMTDYTSKLLNLEDVIITNIVADPKNGSVLDILPNRYENDLIRYFSQFSNK